MATYTVTTNADSGVGTLRDAIALANSNAGADEILFNLTTGNPTETINLLSPLPNLTDNAGTLINAWSQGGPTYTGTPLIELNATSAGAGANGLSISSSNNTVQGLAIDRFTENGIFIASGTNNLIQGNYIGTDLSGTVASPNLNYGLLIWSANNTIGGALPSARNIISGNTRFGIIIQGGNANGNQVLNNFIGTDYTGNNDLGNSWRGVQITDGAKTNEIRGNVVSGNDRSGNIDTGDDSNIGIDGGGTNNNIIAGNFIGTNATGTGLVEGDPAVIGTPPSGGERGILITGGAQNNIIGGTTASDRNIISGNLVNGIELRDTNTSGNQIIGNYIGTDVTGTGALGNSQNGILINGSNNNQIGGTGTNEGNVIVNNGVAGINIPAGTGNSIQGNSISNNVGLGITLTNSTQPKANNDFAGGNGGQNYPNLLSAFVGSNSTVVTAELNASTNTDFRIEFFANNAADPLGNGEGEIFLGFTNVSTDNAGNANISFTHPALLTGQYITASAINLDPATGTNNTSEFSNTLSVDSLSISGLKFHDINGNGLQDLGETGLPNWQFQLLDSSGVLIADATSDANGQYEFDNVLPGDYSLEEVLQSGWTQTVAPNAINLTNADLTDNNFGNFQNISISGIKFEDNNGDGIQNANETGLENWQINLFDAITEAVLETTTTTTGGNYSFIDLEPGNYRVREVNQSGWLQTTPDPDDIVAESGASVNDVNFGNFQNISISGIKFEDNNSDGVQNANEIGLDNWQINLFDATTGSILETTTTTTGGNYSFINLQPGNYRVREVNQSGWLQTTPNPNDIVAESGNIYTDIDFGNLQKLAQIEVLDPTNNNIIDGTNNAVDFGSTFVNTPLTKRFTIKNIGTDDLNLSIPSLPTDFTLVGNFPNLIAPNQVVTFDIALNSASSGTKNGILQFVNSDTNNTPFDFPIIGTVVGTPTPTPTPIPTGTPTPTPIPSGTPTPTPIPTETPTPTPIPTETPTPTPIPAGTPTPTPIPTETPTPTPIPTGTPTPTATPIPTSTNTPIPTATPTPIGTPTPTETISSSPFSSLTNSDIPCLCGEIVRPDLNKPNAVDNIIYSNNTSNNTNSIQFGTPENDAFYGRDSGNIFYGKLGNDNVYGGNSKDILNGNEGSDFIDGSKGNDFILGGKNNDILLGGEGQDFILGNRGQDSINGGEKNDLINGNQGDDFIDGGKGNDSLFGGKNNDVLVGSKGEDSLWGNLGDDTLCGSQANDYLSGNGNNDIIDGCGGNDTIYGGKGNDTLFGCGGDDILYGDLGNDTLIGDSGNDVFVLGIGQGLDIIADFTKGEDLLGLSGGLTFDQLSITQGQDATLISHSISGEVLALLSGVQASQIGSFDFKL